MRTIFLPSVVALALGTWAGATPANAQVPPACPAGYYLASDGQCYPGAPPTYPPPVYEVAPPIYQPPIVIDGFFPGIGFGGSYGGGHGGHEHGGGGQRGGHGGGRR